MWNSLFADTSKREYCLFRLDVVAESVALIVSRVKSYSDEVEEHEELDCTLMSHDFEFRLAQRNIFLSVFSWRPDNSEKNLNFSHSNEILPTERDLFFPCVCISR